MNIDELVLQHSEATVKMGSPDEDFLEHFGVKGMKWGVRRDLRGKVRPGSVVKKDRSETGFEKMSKPSNYANTYAHRKRALKVVYKSARPKIKKGTRLLNQSPSYKDKNLNGNPTLKKKYNTEFSKMVESQLNAASTLKGHDLTKNYVLNFEYNVDTSIAPKVTIKQNATMANRPIVKSEARQVRKLKHADEGDGDEFPMNVVYDELGHIIDMSFDEPLEHSDIDMDDFLEHYGVKGMKWGVRKDRSGAHHPTKSSAGGTAKPKPKAQSGKGLITKSTTDPKTGKVQWHITDKVSGHTVKAVTSRGGADAQKLAEETARQHIDKMKRKAVDKAPNPGARPVKQLSDAELKQAIERINLERQYSQLVNPPKASSKSDKYKQMAETALAKALIEAGANSIKNVAQGIVTAQLTKVAGPAMVNPVAKAAAENAAAAAAAAAEAKKKK